MRILSFVLSAVLFINIAHGFSGWDRANRPGLFDLNYERKLSKLPTGGKLEKTPWSGDYWPTYKGGISYRWAKKTNVDSNRWSYQTKEMDNLSEDQIKNLSPSEKFDLFLGDSGYSLTNYERERTKIMRTVPASELYDSEYKIPTWEGLCHAWAPATYNYINPAPITMEGKLGHKIPFYTSDIKALLTSHVHVNSRYAKENRFLGSRCYLDFKELEKKLKSGEITKEEFQQQIDSKACEDTNAGAFHMVLANQIGLLNKPFIIDMTRDSEVWNQPVEAFQSKIVKEFNTASEGAAPGTVREVLVETTLRYIAEVPQYWTNVIENRSLKLKYYRYKLELNSDDEIIGGAWVSFDRPDFLWDETVPNFRGYFLPLKKIYRKATAYARPKLWENKKEKISKLGRLEIFKKKFIKDTKISVTKRKIKEAARKEYLKRKFIIEAAKDALETRIRKAKRKKYLARRLRVGTKGEILRNRFLKVTKKEVKKTKVKKKIRKLGRVELIKNKFPKLLKKKVVARKWRRTSNLELNSRRFVGGIQSDLRKKKFQRVARLGMLRGTFVGEARNMVETRKETNLAFIAATREGNLKEMRKLLKKGADVNGLEAGLKEEELINEVIKKGNTKIIKLLIKKGASFKTVMAKAAQVGDLKLIRALLTRKANVNYIDEAGNSPLLYAAKTRNKDLIDVLLNRDELTTLNHVDKEGKSALIWAIIATGKRADYLTVEIVKMLVEKGKIDFNLRDKSGNTARSYSSNWKYRKRSLRLYFKKLGAEI